MICLEETGQDPPGEVVREQEKVQVKGLEGPGGWAAAVRAQDPGETVFARAAARMHRISVECRATTLRALSAGQRW